MKNLILLASTILFVIIVFPSEPPFENKENVSESRQRIVVVDTGLSKQQYNSSMACKDSPAIAANPSNKSIIDKNGHGTNIFGLISERINTTKYCITMISVLKWQESTDDYVNALKISSGLSNVVAINLSWTSNMEDGEEIEGERQVLESMDKKGVKIIVAAGNSGFNLHKNCKVFPSCYKQIIKNMTVIGNSNNSSSNYGYMVDTFVDGNKKGTPEFSGTSQSAAIYTGMLFSK